ncbi:MAG: 2-oxoacid:acceptor oxidoreductase [Firmicutes bacterium CAG:24053_14]|jgi:2-oxoglutarate ferredoxin oxidoreductase subunit delta|nr:MAG: 2-oxoacid:acceptor oxidoreductase [Firmicutes bacterium CAG:24053_14]
MAKVFIDIELCKSCKLCAHLCPKGVFEMTGFVNKKGYNYMSAKHEKNCIACKQCENGCPDFAIHIEK